MPLTIVTDMQGQEPDILGPVKHERLRILTLEGRQILSRPAPLGGWTHARLLGVVDALGPDINDGADAFLGESWIGSTEV